jgi:hypothetical protein
VEQAAGLDEDTWRENGLGIKPYSGSLNDVEAILRYVDDAVDTLNAESGPEYYDPSFEIEALPEKKESDSRFSATDEGDSWGVDWIGKENGTEERDTTSSASRSEAPSPQGEGLETGKADSSTSRADVGIGPYGAQNDNEGTGKRRSEARATAPEAPRNDKTGSAARTDVPSSVTAEAVTPSPQGEGFAEQAREKKVEIARKASADGLKSRIQTAEERLKALKSAERMGLVTEKSKRQELQRRIADTQETIDILKAELDRKKEARSAQKADKAARAEAKARRKAEKMEAQKAAELRENRPRQARKEFRQDALNLFSVPAAKRQTLGDLLNRFADKVIHQGSVTEQDRRELFSSLYEAGVETIQGDEYYKQIRDFARGGRIYVPQELRAEFGDDWDAFRKRAWGNGIYLTNDSSDRGADAWNVELAELFPGSFDAQETDSRTILEGIVELAEEGKAEHVSIEEMMLRNQQETGVSVDEQMDELERKVDALIDTFAQKAELEVKLRKAGTMQLVKERQKNREIAARQAQRKKENDTRSQVMKQLQALNKMRKKSAPEIQRQIDEIIGNLDVMARSISPEGLENLQELARKYEEAAKDPNFLGNPYMEQRLARLGKTQLDSLEISDVIELGQTVSALVKSVTEGKRLLTDAREREISDAAEAANKEIRSSEGSKGGKLREFLGNEHLSPTRMIQRLGGWVRGGIMEQLSRALEDGGTRRMDYQRKATRIFDGFVADKENQAWLRKAQGKDAEWIKLTVPAGITGKDVLSGKDGPLVWQNTTFEITPMMRVGLLMHSKNKDNLRHIKTGGIVIPNKAEYIKGNLAEADARGTHVKLQPEVVRAIVKDCTAQERAFAALLEQYYDGFSKDRINEVSMQIDGFERAMTNNYYQIKVSRQFLATQPEQIQKNYALDSIDSIVHERVHAGNPIILEDASTALTGHIDLISKYYGYTAAIRDFNAVMNYTFHQKATTENGQEYTANAFAGSVKKTLGQKWGSGAQKYLDNLLADLQQKSSINETAAQVMAKLRGNLAAASLTLNPAVALSQTASLPGAVQVLGVDGVIAGLKPEKVDMGLVEKYSPVLWYRNQGNSTQELGDYLATKGMGDKLPWWANWIQKMDSWTIRRLWAGAEYRVSKDTDLSPGSKEQIDAGTDAYYQEVARVFQRAVYDTQPNYSEMQRPAILRSKSDLTKALTMYKTVPLQYYNMMYEAVGRLRADAARAKADPSSKQAQAELQKSKAFLAKTFGGILGANVTYVVMKALVKGLLGGKKDKYLDEEGDLDAGKIFGNLGKDLIDTYAGSVIFGSDLLTFGEKLADAITTGKYSRYGGTEISFISAIEDVMGGVYDLATEIHKQDFRGGVGAIKDLAKQIAMVCGIPAQNAETYLRGITKLIAPEWADRYDNLFDEIERGDLKGQTGRDLRAAFRVLLDNRTDGLKDETVEELLRLWGNGQTVQVPSAVPTSISIDGESRNLSADERSRFREIWSKTVSDSLERLIESNGYEQADDIGKAKLIKKLYDYARQQAVEAAVGKEPDAWVLFGKACVAAGVGLEDYLAVAAVGKDKLKGMDGAELDAAIAGRMQFRIGEMDGDSLDELGRLFAAGAADVIPSDVPTSITVGGAEIKFSPEERVAWMQAWGRTAAESLEAVMGSKAYQAADDAGKEKLIAAVYDYARAAAGSSVTDSYAPDKWITIGREAESRGIDADEYIIFRQQAKDLKSAEKLDLLKKQSWTEGQKEYIWMASMASEAQLTKYKPLKESGVKWAAALDLLGVGEASTAGMTQEETARYQAAWDRISGPATKKLMANSAYRTADKATQSAYIDKLNAYTTQTAKAEIVRGYTPEKWVELGQKLSKAGVALDEYIVYSASTSDARSRDKYAALNETGWTERQKLEAMAYISESTHRVATVGMDYQVGLSYYLDALANADADQSGNINQEEAEDYIDRLALGWEDKAYLWQMVCASSKWKNNPYSAGMGEEIWHSLHPGE